MRDLGCEAQEIESPRTQENLQHGRGWWVSCDWGYWNLGVTSECLTMEARPPLPVPPHVTSGRRSRGMSHDEGLQQQQ